MGLGRWCSTLITKPLYYWMSSIVSLGSGYVLNHSIVVDWAIYIYIIFEHDNWNDLYNVNWTICWHELSTDISCTYTQLETHPTQVFLTLISGLVMIYTAPHPTKKNVRPCHWLCLTIYQEVGDCQVSDTGMSKTRGPVIPTGILNIVWYHLQNNMVYCRIFIPMLYKWDISPGPRSFQK